jgi:hypothetical protein
VVANGSYLPFANGTFDQVFSYSVLQHLSRENVRLEIARALDSAGGFLVQMPNCFGIRCLYHQARRGFREGNDFDVRYWTPRELASTFRATFGSAHIFVDGFFSLDPQISDVSLPPWKYRRGLRFRGIAQNQRNTISPNLCGMADSLYVKRTGRNPRLQKIIEQV